MIDYELCVWLTNAIGIATFIFMLITCWPYVVSFFIAFKKVPKVPHSDIKTKFAVIIPARNEAKVIRKNLQSLLKQTYDKNYYDIWVIIESEKDPTSLICKKLGVNYFVRPNIENRKTKGFAIQDLHNYFEENHMNYDAYMIFDADNIVTSRYLEIMNDLRQTGVEVGSGYRNFTNANVNWVSCSSAIFFAYMMSITSNMRTFLFNKATICGTGYYINTDIIREAGGWIFTGMTEDIEVTVYCYYHNINMRYYPEIEFFDEQCDKASTLHKQMTRWIWGYFASKKKFKKVNGRTGLNSQGVYGFAAVTPFNDISAVLENL